MFDKPSDWGTRYRFPENMKLETDGFGARLIENISVQMTDRYEAVVVDTIAREARAAGASDVTVLNKRAILDVFSKRTPRGATRYLGSRCCPGCFEELTGRGLFCSTCGQAIDPKQEGGAETPFAAAPYTGEEPQARGYTATEVFHEQDKYLRNVERLAEVVANFILRMGDANALPGSACLQAVYQLAQDTVREFQQVIYAEGPK